jgi:putative ABC transport system permease protein
VNWWRRKDRERDLDRELRSALELEAEEQRENGLSVDEARHAARRAFGNLTLVKEEVREMWGWIFLDQLKQDLSYAFRSMRKSPGFTATAVLSLALGIGANTAIYSMVRAVLFRQLPYRDADRLVAVWEWNREHSRINTVSGGDYADWKVRNHVFEDLSYSWDVTYTYTGSGDPEAVSAYTLAPNFFAMLGTQPMLGRTFRPDDEEHVVVLAYRFWQRRCSSEAAIVGRAIKLDGQDYTVIGVMPEGFGYPNLKMQMWTPLLLHPGFFSGRKLHALRVAARLKPGVPLETAESEMDAIMRQIERERPDTNKGMGIHIEPIRNFYTAGVRAMLIVLQAAVLMTLLIACANVANLLLARAGAREREVAVRLALGAGRSRLWRQFLTEGMVLALAGSTGGLFVAYWGVQALTALLPESTADFAAAANARAWIDFPVLVATLAISIAAGLAFGAAPAFHLHGAPRGALGAGTRGLSENAAKVRLRSLLVVSQVALSLLLLIGAGLMARSLLRLFDRQLGFRADHLLTMILTLPPNRYPDAQRTTPFIQQVLAKVEATNGVESIAAINTLPLTGMDALRNFTIPGRPELNFAQQANAAFRLVTPRYFRTMRIPLLRGRWFEERDQAGAPGVAIINETLARHYWPGEDPIGKSISVADGATPVAREIVGVVGDTRDHGLADSPPPEIYRPFYQAYWPFLGLVVGSTREPADLANAVSRAIWSVDKEQPVTSIITMDQLLAASIGSRRNNTILLGAFGLIAALLAALGLYGVIAYSVQRRTQEIGIRMALGARGGDVMAGVLKQALLLTAGGVLIGLSAAFAATRFLRSMLVEIGATDPLTFLFFPLMLTAVALLAAYVPARRASRVDPTIALRYE